MSFAFVVDIDGAGEVRHFTFLLPHMIESNFKHFRRKKYFQSSAF